MEAALTSYLLAQTSLTALIGQRLTWDERDQGGQEPAIVLYVVSGPRDYHMTGASGLAVNRIQADCIGRTKKEAKQAADALEAVVSGRRFTRSGIRFDGIFILDDGSDTTDVGGETRFRRRLDLEIHHAKSA